MDHFAGIVLVAFVLPFVVGILLTKLCQAISYVRWKGRTEGWLHAKRPPAPAERDE